MPIYEYECLACQHKLDSLQKVDEAPLVDCPACGGASLQKIISAASFQLKGTGWYATDFRQKSSPEAPSDSGGSSAASSTTDTKK